MRRKTERGFSLLEIIVAIAIFSIIASISYAALNQFLDTRDQLSEKHDQIRSIQTTMTVLGRDFRFMLDRSVRDGFGDPEAAILAGDELALTEGESDSNHDQRAGRHAESYRQGPAGWVDLQRRQTGSYRMGCPRPGPGYDHQDAYDVDGCGFHRVPFPRLRGRG